MHIAGDRPTRQTSWPGDPPADSVEDLSIHDREEEFVNFVFEDVARRRTAETASWLRSDRP